MGTLAIDIETASPFTEPDEENRTECYEWLSVAVAYANGQDELEQTVLFRQGGWEHEHTAELLGRLIDWCRQRDIERTLTYNGTRFDLKHMANWAESLDEAGVRSGALDDLISCLPSHIDLALAAADRHRDELWESQVVLPDWKAYTLEGIDNDRVYYDDYAFNDDYRDGLGIDEQFVQGKHVGRVLGERYVEGIAAGIEDTREPTGS